MKLKLKCDKSTQIKPPQVFSDKTVYQIKLCY